MVVTTPMLRWRLLIVWLLRKRSRHVERRNPSSHPLQCPPKDPGQGSRPDPEVPAAGCCLATRAEKVTVHTRGCRQSLTREHRAARTHTGVYT